ncbi:hypothetical protein [Companilactobacillus nantensis]|nr:hypothetical protein [Companilactobacillus nantensis]
MKKYDNTEYYCDIKRLQYNYTKQKGETIMSKSDELLKRVSGEIMDESSLNTVKGGSWDWSKLFNNATCAVGGAVKIAGAVTGSTATCGK